MNMYTGNKLQSNVAKLGKKYYEQYYRSFYVS